jgi:hypothetical protein
MLGGSDLSMDQLFVDGTLSDEGTARLKESFPAKQANFRAGMNKVEMFSLLTVADLHSIIAAKLEAGGANA